MFHLIWAIIFINKLNLGSPKLNVSASIFFYSFQSWIKLRLPIWEIWCGLFQLFRSLAYFILPFTEVENFSDRKTK